MAFDKAPGLRLDNFIKSLGINQKEFAARLQTSDKFISQILNGHSNLTVRMVYKIGEVFPQMNKDWVLKGEGEMLLPDQRQAMGVQEPGAPYVTGGGSPLANLDVYLNTFEARLQRLEERVRALENPESNNQ